MTREKNERWENYIIRAYIGISRIPKVRHWSTRKINTYERRMKRFQTSKAGKKARWKKSTARWRKRFWGK
jgi:hypothetical protein